jgi:hypothetical protein
MKSKKTVWSIFKDLVNSKEIGEEITRLEILKEIDKNYNDNAMDRPESFGLKYSPVTLDCYRNMAEKVGYLGKTNRPGRYKVLRHISLTSGTALRKEYNLSFIFRQNSNFNSQGSVEEIFGL